MPVSSRGLSVVQLWSDGLLEAGWLTALIVAPLLFNPYANVVFENGWLVRGIALLMGAAGTAKLIDSLTSGQSGLRRSLAGLRRMPLALPVASLVAAYGLSTCLSVVPGLSWWGSPQREQGTFTFFGYVVIFASVAFTLRRWEQVERLVGAVALLSLPLSLYALMQRLNADPLQWSVDPAARVFGTLGNPDFLAGYLAMAIPLVAVGFVRSAQACLSPRPTRLSLARAAAYGFVLLVQVLSAALSGGRAGALGLLVGGLLAAAAFALAIDRRRVALAILAAGGVVGLAMGGVVFAASPVQALATAPGFNRVAHVLDETDGSSRVRLLLWRSAASMFLPHSPLRFSANGTDRLNAVRPLIGYGPETLVSAFAQYTTGELDHYERPVKIWDRTHNQTWDALLTTGIMGAAAYWWVFVSLVYLALRAAGLGRGWGAFVLCAAGGAACGLAIGMAAHEFLGLAVGLGTAAGIAVYEARVTPSPAAAGEGWGEGTWRCGTSHPHPSPLPPAGEGTPPRIPRRQRLLAVALFGAAIAHYVETQFAFGVTPTETMFWVCAGLVVALSRSHPSGGWLDAANLEPSTSSRIAPLLGAAVPAFVSLVVGLVLAYDFVTFPARADALPSAVSMSLTSLYQGQRGVAYTVATLLLATWLASVVMWRLDRRSASLVLLIPPVLWLAYVAGHLVMLRGPGGAAADTAAFVARTAALSQVFTLLGGVLIGLCLLLSLALTLGRGPRSTPRVPSVAAAVLLFAAAVGAALYTSVWPVRASILLKFAGLAQAWQASGATYQAAAELAPFEQAPLLGLGYADLSIGQGSDSAGAEAPLSQAQAALARAGAIDGLNPLPKVYLARVAEQRTRWSASAAEREAWRKAADDDFAAALIVDPHRPWHWTEWAQFSAQTPRDYGAALDHLESAFAVDREWGDTYRALDGLATNQSSSEWRAALDLYEQAGEAAAASDRFLKLLVVGTGRAATAEWQAAIVAYRDALSMAPADINTWAIHRALARCYARLGDKTSSDHELELAASLARPLDKAAASSL